MPSLSQLALRYLLWFVGLRLLYMIAVQLTGMPNSPATFVILAAVPAVDIGMRASMSASRVLGIRDWAVVWAVMVAINAVFQVALPAITLPEFRAGLSNPDLLTQVLTILTTTGIMLALFLWIGARIKRAA
ncbi:MAG: hypothetical protein AAF376_15700 [Pseudomonadota bacterium]